MKKQAKSGEHEKVKAYEAALEKTDQVTKNVFDGLDALIREYQDGGAKDTRAAAAR